MSQICTNVFPAIVHEHAAWKRTCWTLINCNECLYLVVPEPKHFTKQLIMYAKSDTQRGTSKHKPVFYCTLTTFFSLLYVGIHLKILFQLQYIWVDLQYNSSLMYFHIRRLKIFQIGWPPAHINHILNDYFYTNKSFFSFFSFFYKKCTNDFYRSTMMSLSEMHNMVTRVHIAIEVGLITAYIGITC